MVAINVRSDMSRSSSSIGREVTSTFQTNTELLKRKKASLLACRALCECVCFRDMPDIFIGIPAHIHHAVTESPSVRQNTHASTERRTEQRKPSSMAGHTCMAAASMRLQLPIFQRDLLLCQSSSGLHIVNARSVGRDSTRGIACIRGSWERLECAPCEGAYEGFRAKEGC